MIAEWHEVIGEAHGTGLRLWHHEDTIAFILSVTPAWCNPYRIVLL